MVGTFADVVVADAVIKGSVMHLFTRIHLLAYKALVYVYNVHALSRLIDLAFVIYLWPDIPGFDLGTAVEAIHKDSFDVSTIHYSPYIS